jgi:GT2 family glycosyltransferase
MITHNRREEVLRSLGHISRLPERPRITVVDNGSSDDTPAAIAAAYPDVQVIAVGANLGAAGRTLGARQVSARYTAFSDDDTWWEPGALRRAADLLDAYPRLAILSGRVLVGPEEREDPTCALMRDSPVPREPGMPGPALLGFLAGGAIVRRSAFLEVGGFPSHLRLGGEEEWLAIDLAARGWWICYDEGLVVHHYPAPRRDGTRRHWQILRNALWFAWLRRPLGSAVRRTVQLVREAGWHGTTFLACGAAVAGLPRLLPQRRVVPAAVEEGLRRLEALHRAGQRAAAGVTVNVEEAMPDEADVTTI